MAQHEVGGLGELHRELGLKSILFTLSQAREGRNAHLELAKAHRGNEPKCAECVRAAKEYHWIVMSALMALGFYKPKETSDNETLIKNV